MDFIMGLLLGIWIAHSLSPTQHLTIYNVDREETHQVLVEEESCEGLADYIKELDSTVFTICT